MYFAMANTCAWTTSAATATATPEMLYAIATENVIAPDAGGKVGTLRSISVETGKASWRYDQRAALMALLATGGDLVFGGDVAGMLRAFDAETGKVLWETNLGAPVTGHPVTFAVDGKQYVAVSTGRSNMTGGLTRLTPEVVPAESANKLFVFALPDSDPAVATCRHRWPSAASRTRERDRLERRTIRRHVRVARSAGRKR